MLPRSLAVLSRAAFTRAALGSAPAFFDLKRSTNSATVPAMAGADMEVPLSTCERLVWNVESTSTPMATMSGLMRLSRMGPALEKSAAASCASTAPTVMMFLAVDGRPRV